MVENQVSIGLWERRTKGERGGEIVVSERWVAPTNVELEKGGAGESGAVDLWERRTNGGLCFGLKVEPLSCVLRWGNGRVWICVLEEGKDRRMRRQRAACGGTAKPNIGF